MRCHYEVLGIPLTASNEEIKKAYRKCALQWHPDKHVDSNNKEEANKKFLEIQDAYDTLIEPNDRAWYDSHREIIINGGTPGDPSEANYTFNVFPFFSPTCFRGYEDDEKGFYSVYRDMFTKIADEDRPYYDEDVRIPSFGNSTSDYDEIVGPFYAFWMSYCTPRSFVWAEQYDTREANDRQVRRAMDKENKKFKDKAKKERNEEIRKIVSIVRKRDKRVDQYKKMLEEKALLNQKKSQEKREADRQRRVEQMKAYVEPEWSAVDKKLEELDLAENPKPKIKTNNESDDENNDENSNANNNQEEDDDDFDESLFCVACNKSFKNEKSFLNHEKSKKHRENIDLLKKHMKEEDKNALFGEENEKDDSDAEETKKPSEKVKLSKKQKKKRKQNKNLSSSGDENEEAADNTDETKDILKVDDLSEVIDATNFEVDQSLSTQKEEEIVNIEDITFKTNSKTEAPANEPKKAICSVCNKEFESRSKLFLHIKEEGHAAPKLPEQPMSHNSVKRNKRLAKSKK